MIISRTPLRVSFAGGRTRQAQKRLSCQNLEINIRDQYHIDKELELSGDELDFRTDTFLEAVDWLLKSRATLGEETARKTLTGEQMNECR